MLNVFDVVGPSPGQWNATITGMRNSWESWEKGDSEMIVFDHPEFGRIPYRFRLGDSDRALALRLAKLGGDHGKYLRMLPIHITADTTEYWLKQLYTYRAGLESIGYELSDLTINASSHMHTLGREPFAASMFAWGDMHDDHQISLLMILNALRDTWVASGKRKPSPEWTTMLAAIPQGWIYRVTISLNYQVARAIYHSRQHHRLDAWRTLCDCLERLDYAELITER